MPSTQTKTTVSFALSAALLALASTGFAADAPKGSKGAAVAANDKVKGFRTKQVAVIIDLDAAVRFYWVDNRDAFAELVQKLADADARSSRRVAKGVEFREERVL